MADYFAADHPDENCAPENESSHTSFGSFGPEHSHSRWHGVDNPLPEIQDTVQDSPPLRAATHPQLRLRRSW